MNGLEIVETFYLEPLTPNLISVIAHTPPNQLMVLAEQFAAVASSQGTVAAAQTSIVARDGVPPMALDTLCLPASIDRPLSQSVSLRRMLLYVDSIAVTDPIALWAIDVLGRQTSEILPLSSAPLVDEVSSARTLARILNGVLPLRDLIRSQALQLVEPPTIRWNRGMAASDNLTIQHALARRAPEILRQLLENSEPQMFGYHYDRAYLEELLATDLAVADYAWGVSRLADFLVDRYYGLLDEDFILYGVADAVFGDRVTDGYQASILQAVAFDDFTFANGLIPIALRTPNAQLLSFRAEAQHESMPVSVLESAELPSVDIAWADLTLLRANDEVFAMFRAAIGAAVRALESHLDEAPTDLAYSLSGSLDANVTPVLETLERHIKRSGFLSAAVPRFARFGFSLSARLLPHPLPGAGAAGQQLGSRAVRHATERAAAARIASRILGALRTGA